MNVLSKFFKKNLASSIVHCKCATCGEIFLDDTTVVDFIATSNMFKLEKSSTPDEWFIKAFQHFKRHSDHKMVPNEMVINVLELGLIGKADLVLVPQDLAAYVAALEAPVEVV